VAEKKISRRAFVRDGAAAAIGIAAGFGVAKSASAADQKETEKILNCNPKMEYHRLGKTELMVSAVCLGGHWKRVNIMAPDSFQGGDWLGVNLDDPGFVKNRYDVVSRCMEVGMNYIDACTGQEVMAYAKALKGRRDKMYLGYSWYQNEMRFKPWQDSVEKMMEGFEKGLKEAGLDYVDLWRITMHEQTSQNNTPQQVEIAMEALSRAKKSGKARFTGVSSHDRPWLKETIEKYPDQMDVIVTPYTARSKVLPGDSLFGAVKKCDVGVFGIKPFASNSLFRGNSAPDSPDAEEDDRRARLTIRYILCNTAITAPIPGLINAHQVDNVAKAVMEHRELDVAEAAELEKAADEMWAKLPEEYQWLKDWEYV
jgi:predicted aldo/keto reductase-like oxidoreductase